MRRTAAIILGAACLLGFTATAATAAPTHTAVSSAPVDSCGSASSCHDNVFNFDMDSNAGSWH
ncbi:hypothetical protein ACIBCO_39920 [Streptomyces violascens]|uniref:hypothetical protein n=1 Tax=Streptomyces violascens TaxID=67381 RepID=UPI0037B829A5